MRTLPTVGFMLEPAGWSGRFAVADFSSQTNNFSVNIPRAPTRSGLILIFFFCKLCCLKLWFTSVDFVFYSFQVLQSLSMFKSAVVLPRSFPPPPEGKGTPNFKWRGSANWDVKENPKESLILQPYKYPERIKCNNDMCSCITYMYPIFEDPTKSILKSKYSKNTCQNFFLPLPPKKNLRTSPSHEIRSTTPGLGARQICQGWKQRQHASIR